MHLSSLAALLLAAATGSHSAQRPNILFLFADDWGRHASAYAKVEGPGSMNDTVSTPNFDRVAEAGVLFLNAYVNSPSCTPCRSSLLSGQHFWRTGNGAILQGATWDSKIPSWPLLLEAGGYDIGYSYKVWAPGTPLNAPIGEKRTRFEQAGKRFNSFSQTATALIKKGSTVEEAKAALLDEARGNFRSFLETRGQGKPFAFWFGPTNVHRKWIKGSGKKLWNIDPDSLKGKMPPFLPDVHEVRQDFADYLGEAQAFDAAIGVLIEELKRSGKFENTIIAISGDHGAPGFPHGKCNLYDFGTQVSLALSGPGIGGGRVVNDFVSLPDLAPTFLEAGQVDVPSVMTAKTLWPVLAAEKDGWVDPARTGVYIGRERHVRKARAGNLPYPQRAIRTREFLLVINFRPDRYPLGDPFDLDNGKAPSSDKLENNTFATLPDEDAGPAKAWIVEHRNDPKWQTYFQHAYGKRPRLELFDVQKDPFQMNNLADNPEYREVVARLQKQLLAEMKATGDPRLIDEGRFFEDVSKFDGN
ncbi:Arylsulfatase [Pontiella desulfatans]|uniref:Arylsulfatase n=2 Tax=Pontiella desulfatans TaxID=2750659 RepID=A0A6C2UDP1_PONDE|nr:sulfatase S1_8 [Kiritimatiellales bacterium]VGO17494.1 Arylsulfatase [Pontiella desulfatans]